MSEHFVYLVRCSDDTLYCGYTTDVDRRVTEHNGRGKVAGAKYTTARQPVTLVYQESCNTRSNAMKREAAIKKLTRKEKEALFA